MEEERIEFLKEVVSGFNKFANSHPNKRIARTCNLAGKFLEECLEEIDRLQKVLDQYHSVAGAELSPAGSMNGFSWPEEIRHYGGQYDCSKFPELTEELRNRQKRHGK